MHTAIQKGTYTSNPCLSVPDQGGTKQLLGACSGLSILGLGASSGEACAAAHEGTEGDVTCVFIPVTATLTEGYVRTVRWVHGCL